MEKAAASKPLVQQNIFEPRYIKWDSFSDLPYEFEDLFTFQGWMEFSELNEYYYPYLIQEFYGSTAGPSNAKAAGPSRVKISEVEEEEEEHVEATEKVQEESKIAEVEEVEKNDEKEKSAEEASEAEQEPDREIKRILLISY
ncbi:hypothetical protein GH714_021623 [Hevea brasiliensis]|uniref:Uncharacterized protein n=1 Tax=Hevea brasiliensis TaxID=3981 RepID=A0A6A6LCW8_HEVBR|nr:hypothetical protein GH714_021623 [Hevea brasiliensis]